LGSIKAAHGIRLDGGSLYINRNIDPNRTGSSGASQVCRLFEMVADAFRVLDGHGVLRNRLDQGDNIDLLTATLAHSERSAIGAVHAIGAFHLPRDDEHGSRIKPCSDHASDRIGAARAGRYRATPKLSVAFE